MTSVSYPRNKQKQAIANPQNRTPFFETINLRGHMPRFTLKMNVFPSISLAPHKCVLKPSEQGSFFQDNQFEGSHA